MLHFFFFFKEILKKTRKKQHHSFIIATMMTKVQHMIAAYWADWEVECGPTDPHLGHVNWSCQSDTSKEVQLKGRSMCLKSLLDLCDVVSRQY